MGIWDDVIKGGAKLGDEIIIPAGKSGDDVIKQLGGSSKMLDDGRIMLPSGKFARVPGKATHIKKGPGGYYTKWDESWEVIDNVKFAEITAAANIEKATTWNVPALGRFLPGKNTVLNLGWISVVGGITYAILMPLLAFSSNLTETINNFFGGDSDGDGVPDAKGARNQLLFGGVIICLGLYSLSSFFSSGKKSSGEKQVVEIQVTGDTPSEA